MEKETTKRRILSESLNLFSRDGYEAVSVEQIANAVGIKAPSLYKHYRSKRDIFCSILQTMEQRDRENAAACSLPEMTMDMDPQAYAQASVADLITFSRMQFRYWTEDEFAASFRRMLTVEQYRSEEMNRLYHQYLGSGPLSYVADLLGSQEEALLLYGPMHMLYSVYDEAQDKSSVLTLLDTHLERWKK
ncbi:MAG: TetR/AcrR family transcriptional regulator [Clostridiales bacterium]|nr:TetR/AcrR family transcriptional regulator [Clostridiales bacterium]